MTGMGSNAAGRPGLTCRPI